jgi:hypothetical protein
MQRLHDQEPKRKGRSKNQQAPKFPASHSRDYAIRIMVETNALLRRLRRRRRCVWHTGVPRVSA